MQTAPDRGPGPFRVHRISAFHWWQRLLGPIPHLVTATRGALDAYMSHHDRAHPWIKAASFELCRCARRPFPDSRAAALRHNAPSNPYGAEAGGFLNVVARQGDRLPVGALLAQLFSAPGEKSADRPTPHLGASPSSCASRPELHTPSHSGDGAVSADFHRVKASPPALRVPREHRIGAAAPSGCGQLGPDRRGRCRSDDEWIPVASLTRRRAVACPRRRGLLEQQAGLHE